MTFYLQPGAPDAYALNDLICSAFEPKGAAAKPIERCAEPALKLCGKGICVRTLLALAVLSISSIALAAPITFNLRDTTTIEPIDDVNSFSLTQDSLTATLSAEPATFNEPPLRNLVLNVTTSSFGVNVDGTTCAPAAENSAQIDGGCIPESIDIFFDHGVFLNSLRVSSFGSTDEALVTIGATTIDILSTGAHLLGDTFLAKGDPWSIAFVAGNGFSFDNFTVTVPEPGTLALLCAALAAGGLLRGKRTQRLPLH